MLLPAVAAFPTYNANALPESGVVEDAKFHCEVLAFQTRNVLALVLVKFIVNPVATRSPAVPVRTGKPIRTHPVVEV